jgi:hypothetical protein
MRYLNLQNAVLISTLVAGLAATTGCSSGTDAPGSPAGSGGGTSTGAAGSTGSGTGGDSSGTAGSTTTTTGGGSTTAGGGGSGTGGSTGAGGSGNNGPPSICDGKGTRVLMAGDSKVDDFEGAMISPGWSSFSDVMPTPNSFKITQEAGGALNTGHFGHYAGTGAKTTAKGGYGVGTVYNVAIDTKAGIYCIDISAFDGVTFWAKAAKDMTKVNVNFVLPETNQADPVNGGGDCVKDSGCYNHPYKTVTLGTTWAQVSVAFADAGMGTLPGGGAAKVHNRIQELVWISLDQDWDFSLDEIQFYKGTPPTGPVGM